MRVFILLIFLLGSSFNAAPKLQLALLKYSGGGDWYANPTALKNLANFCNENIGTDFDPKYETVEVGSVEIFNHPFLHMTGHGNVVFSDAEAENLRMYLMSGGFLHIDDNYGMDVFVRPSMKKVFPEIEFVELPFDHGIYNAKFKFTNGPAQGFGLIWEDRLVCFYTYESDIGDGWEDAEVHKDSPEKRLNALRMGCNIIEYSFTQ